MKVIVAKEILKANDQVAAENRETFDREGVRVINVMASPGAGKTSTILATIERLQPELKSGQRSPLRVSQIHQRLRRPLQPPTRNSSTTRGARSGPGHAIAA